MRLLPSQQSADRADLRFGPDRLVLSGPEERGGDDVAWISVHEQVLGGKLRSLAKELGCSQNEALGLLVRLWLWGINNANPDGKLESADKDDIADVLNIGIDRRCNPGDAVEAMITTGWLDFDDGYLYIHDWKEWQKQWYKALKVRESDNERKAKERAKRKAAQPALPPETSSPKPVQQEEAYTIPPEPPQKPTTAYTTEFEEFWSFYPRKIGKGDAYKCYQARRKDGWSPGELLEASKNYAVMTAKEHTETKYIKHPKTFLSASTPFLDYIKRNGQAGTGSRDRISSGNIFKDMMEEYERGTS